MLPKISIVTPTYNMLPYLKRCLSSVQDQNVRYEHIVVDGNSSDGTKAWLQQSKGLHWLSEKDNGMYDALNKGLAMAEGEIIGHLNADEQYLPGALDSIAAFFDRHPEVDFVVADFLLVDKAGELIAYRKSFPLFWPFFFSNYLYAYTCTLFYRKKVADQLKYDSSLKSIADVDFVYKIMKSGFKGAHIPQYVAAFTFTGNNLSANPISITERREYEKKNLPLWFKITKPAFRLGFYAARFVYGTLRQKGGLAYELYDSANLEQRRKFIINRPSYKWADVSG